LVEKSTSIGELHRLQNALFGIEGKLDSIRKFLPRQLRKRGLFNIGGSALQYLFAVAIQIDLQTLHSTVQELHARQDGVSHSIQQQLTYFKQLDERVAGDHKTLVTLSHDLKSFAQQAQEAFQEVAAKFSWAAKLRESAELITSLELALSRVEVQLDEALTALQFGINGRVPVNLVPPFVFRNILTNVSLSLFDSYELIRGISADLSWFYQFECADMVATDRGFLLILSIPLKDITTQYEVYRIFSFPIAGFDCTYTRLIIDTPYFADNLMQRTHLLLSASDVGQCKGGPELRVCPANVAVLTNEIKSCPLSLYLQLGQAPQVCAQELLRSPPNTSLFRHGTLVLFYTNPPRRAFFKWLERVTVDFVHLYFEWNRADRRCHRLSRVRGGGPSPSGSAGRIQIRGATGAAVRPSATRFAGANRL
jgi:hypothetical protein